MQIQTSDCSLPEILLHSLVEHRHTQGCILNAHLYLIWLLLQFCAQDTDCCVTSSFNQNKGRKRSRAIGGEISWACKDPGVSAPLERGTRPRPPVVSPARPGMSSRGSGGQSNGALPQTKICQFKLVLLGDMAVGKSSLVLRFVKGQFDEFQETTIGGEDRAALRRAPWWFRVASW